MRSEQQAAARSRALPTKTELFIPGSGSTDIFITPGYRFKAVDALITNFHLPESTLLMLISAFSSREEVMRIYKHAVEERYRFSRSETHHSSFKKAYAEVIADLIFYK